MTPRFPRLTIETGPLVRINPDEIHCSDPCFSDEIYPVGGRKRDRTLHQINGAAVSVYMSSFDILRLADPPW